MEFHSLTHMTRPRTTVRIREMVMVSLALLTPLTGISATIWNGPLLSFSKTNFANPTLPANQDQLTTNVWITRGSSQGLFNAVIESNFRHSISPSGTEWANGTLANYDSLSYTNWNIWAKGVNTGPPATVGIDAVVHLIADDIYFSVKFTSWTEGANGGGFA